MHREKIKTYLIQFFLFVTTLTTTTLAGYTFTSSKSSSFEAILQGLYFSIPFLGILTIHEFGHYITARLYKVKVTLPYFIPFFTFIGTLGAFIKMKSKLRSKKEIFDIGIAGPLAGFVAALIILCYGFTHLPPREHIFTIHPEYQKYGLEYEKYVYNPENKDPESISYKIGDNLLFQFFKKYVAADPSLVPNTYELIHYPFLFAGFWALFFTALNLLPIGQTDGGHILYGLVGAKRQRQITPVIFTLFVFIGGLGIFSNDNIFGSYVPLGSFENFIGFAPFYLFLLYLIFSKVSENKITNFLIATVVFTLHFFLSILMPSLQGAVGYLVFALLFGRFLGIYHPPAEIEEPLSTSRKILGWVALIIFIICFSPQPIMVE
ncbi:MAG: site-2 protease family protein [Sporocytophaga sp.]|uniref:site-2 protease family protein n=1 Tax=Sporocytophaga sp. TaxID=2231183 RepID=UPI001B0E04EB|nr:site-2 protease family protein [Sporocytophaga sp.]MBO9701386.1 site-2 protease family protein [Sporocytophaga sp.]